MGYVDKTRSKIMKAAAKQAALPQKTPSNVISSQKRQKMTKGKGDKKCPLGQILRFAYISHSGKPFPSSCIEKRGKSDNKNANVVVLHKGRLAQYGYFDVTNMKQVDRRNALIKALDGEGKQMIKEGKIGSAWLSIFRRLIYMGTLTKNTDPLRSKIF